jgi:hypothetical protein
MINVDATGEKKADAVVLYKLLCVVAITETVDDGSGCIGIIVVGDTVIGCPTVVNDADMPEATVWVAPPLEDDHAVVSYFAASGVKEYLTLGVS